MNFYYKTRFNNRIIGYIFQELPEQFPEDWTIGIGEANLIMTLPKVLFYLSNNYPGVKLEKVWEN